MKQELTEEAMRNTKESELHCVIGKGIPLPVIVSDKKGIIIFANIEACEALKRTDLKGLHVGKIYINFLSSYSRWFQNLEL